MDNKYSYSEYLSQLEASAEKSMAEDKIRCDAAKKLKLEKQRLKRQEKKLSTLKEYSDELTRVASRQLTDFENQQVDSLDNNDICPNTVDLETENQLSADVEILLDFLGQYCASQPQRTPTYIEASLVKWDKIRPILHRNTITGMETRNLSLSDRITLLPSTCQVCNQPIIEGSVTTTLKVISNNGLTETAINVPYCELCSWAPVQLCEDFPKIGLWPLTPEGKVFVEFSYLLHNSMLQHHSPTLSMKSMLSSLKFISALDGKQRFSMSQDTFNCCFLEWKKAEAFFLHYVAQTFYCPCCGASPHAVHIDGNMKLYRYKAAGRVTVEEAVPSHLFLDDSEVKNTVEKICVSKNKYSVDGHCGETAWKAAKTASGSFSKKSVTGCMMATCRHALVLKALDMDRGEVFAYPYIMQKQFSGAKYIATDVMCQYYPWLSKIDAQCASSQKYFLSVMHAKAHIWTCQARWSGRVRKGVGLSTGETTEQTNSYMSRCGLITRHMTASGRRQQLEHAAGFWNFRKIKKMPEMLAKKIKQIEMELPKRYVTMVELKESEIPEASSIEEVMDRICSSSPDLTADQRKLEDLACTIQRFDANILKLADSSKRRDRLRSKRRATYLKLQKAVDEYVQNHSELSHKDFDLATSMIFPWTGSEIKLSASPNLLKLFDAYHLYNRTVEELDILGAERKNLLEYAARMAASLNDGHHNDDTISTRFKQAFLQSCYVNFSGSDQECVQEEIIDDDDLQPIYSDSSDED